MFIVRRLNTLMVQDYFAAPSPIFFPRVFHSDLLRSVEGGDANACSPILADEAAEKCGSVRAGASINLPNDARANGKGT